LDRSKAINIDAALPTTSRPSAIPIGRGARFVYFVGWGVAVALPVGIALLLLRYHAQTPVDEAEVLMQLEEMQPDLLALPEAKPNELPSPTEAAPESDPEAEDKPDADAPDAGRPCP
jgi:hypothetical protein